MSRTSCEVQESKYLYLRGMHLCPRAMTRLPGYRAIAPRAGITVFTEANS